MRERANKPLTLEQLKQMNGRPVWWWNKSQKPTVTICLFDRFSKEPSFVSYDFVSEDATKISKYSLIRRWGYLPYASDPTAQQPDHIDREKWERCTVCGSNVFVRFSAWKSGEDTENAPYMEGGARFCPSCGRPRLPQAWAELERRVFGG